MNNGRIFQKTPTINYCVKCRRFYVTFCYCWLNFPSNKSGELSVPSTIYFNEILALNSMKEFLYVITIISNYYRNTLIKFKANFDGPLYALNGKNEENLKIVATKDFHHKDNSNFFSKYIHLCNYGGKTIEPIRYFCVYMMTAHLEKENEATQQTHGQPPKNPSSPEQSLENTPRNEISETSSPSTCSLASKKSGVLSRISRTLKRKKKSTGSPQNGTLHEDQASVNLFSQSEGEQTEISTAPNSPVPKFHSRSRIPIPKPKVKGQKSKEESQVLLGPKVDHKSRSFFRKLVPKPSPGKVGLGEVSKEPSSDETLKPTNVDELEKKSGNCGKGQGQNLPPLEAVSAPRVNDVGEFYCRASSSHVCNQFRSNSTVSLNLNLGESLREVINLSQRLQESESHLTHIISKYIQDPTFEKELLSILTNHAKLHLEAERRAQNLAHEMWLQQSDMMKAQEISLQENLNALVKQNRKLQEEMENLVKKNEKISIAKERQLPSYMRQPHDSSNHVIENLSKNNDKLRYKASGMAAQIEEQEKELQILQRRNQLLEQQIRNSGSQLQSYKAILQRVQTDNELEHANLSHQLQVSQMTIKESAEAGDVLLEDLDALKRQMKSMPCGLNWTKFKSRGNSLPDLLYMCRSCINELAKELLKSQTDLILKDKDNDGLKDELKRIEETLESSKSEQESLRVKLKSSEAHEMDLKKYMAKCSEVERELGEYKQQMERVIGEFEKEKISFNASIEDMENLNKKIIEREEELILSKEKMCEYKSENDALRMQIHGLKQVLTASGTGDVARELADTQEKMTFFQSQYYQLLSEKNYLIEQLQTANLERGALNQFQNNYYQFIQVQQQDLELLNRDNLILRQELEVERNQISVLKSERAKLREEKNIMRQIYHQLKNEINRVQKLQGEVTGMNIEANRLAIIAEYNKQLGEKLQCEVAERDVKISELRSSVEKLNNAQIESTKDKVALCVELTEVCTITNQLNSSLVAEHHKSTQLNESKKKFENSANTQLKAVEQMQRAERAALRELLKDYKNVVTQRDNLVASQNEYLQQISDLRTNAVIQARHIEETNNKCMQALGSIENLKTKLNEYGEELERVRGEVDEKENANISLEEKMTQVKTQNETLESSKTYLQNTVQKLHNDLNECRKTELDAKQALKRELKRTEALQHTLDQTKAAMAQATAEKQTIVQEAAHFNQVYENVLADHAANVANSTKIEEELKRNLEETKELVKTSSKEKERLEKVIAEKDLEVIELQNHSKNLVLQLEQMESSLDEVDSQSKLLSESNLALVKLQTALNSLELEHQGCSHTISMLKDEKYKLQGELEKHISEMDANYSHYKSYIEEIIEEHNGQKEQMEADLHILSAKLQDMKNSCEDEKKAHVKLLGAHKDLAAKLLKAVRMLIDEKLARQNAEARVAKLSDQITQLITEKEITEKTVNLISSELEEVRARIGDLIADKKTLQGVLSDLQELYKRSQSRCRLSEQKLQEVNRNRKSPSTHSSKIITLKETRSKLQTTEERTKKLRNDLEKGHKSIMELKADIANLKQQLTVMEFQKCETSLRLHETEGKLKTEQSVNAELADVNKKLVNEIIKMKRDGIITQPVSETLLGIVQDMEHISSQQLAKYESIISQIDSEFKKYELLKKEVEKETNKLVAVRVTMEENFAKENVFRVTVKIFSSIFEIFYLYSEDISKKEFECLRKLSDCKFYVVEVYISKLFQQKIINQNWLLNICIRNSTMSVSKNVPVSSKEQNDGHILVVVPFDTSTETSTVHTTLFMNFDNFCSALRISTLTLDISHHFTSYEKPSISPILKIAQNYDITLDKNLLKVPTLEYNFKCKCSTRHFFESVVKNCYHRLKPQIFSAFNAETLNIVNVHFSIDNGDDATIKLDKTENVLSVTCNVQDLHRIKRHFIEEIHCQKVSVEKIWLVALMNMKQYLRSELGQPQINPDNLQIIYEELRKLMFDLPV